MNFVVFSWNFLPQSDPESFCTARFVNALREAGHMVTVVTVKHRDQLSSDICAQILRSDVRIVEVEGQGFFPSWIERLAARVALGDWCGLGYGRCFKALVTELRRYESPILISRSSPLRSGLIAYKCRGLARAWIAHFSDPLPWVPTSTVKQRMVKLLLKRVVARILRSADGISITCNQVKAFFEKEYPTLSSRVADRFFTTQHIGDPVLKCSGCNFGISNNSVPVVSHCGFLSEGRYGKELIENLQALRVHGVKVRFLQFGTLDGPVKKRLSTTGLDLEVVENLDPAASSELFARSAVCVVLDTKTEFETSLFLPSKFVYMLFADTPVVVYTPKNSAMHKCVVDYPEAGLVWADVLEKDSLAKAISLALDSSFKVDRTRVRQKFSRVHVARKFVEDVSRMISKRGDE